MLIKVDHEFKLEFT